MMRKLAVPLNSVVWQPTVAINDNIFGKGGQGKERINSRVIQFSIFY